MILLTVTPEEDIDENNLDEDCIKDVAGFVEIHAAATERDNFTITLDQQTHTKPTLASVEKWFLLTGKNTPDFKI